MNDKLVQHVSDRIIGLIIMAENNMMSEPFAKRVADRVEASLQIAKAAIEAAGVEMLTDAVDNAIKHEFNSASISMLVRARTAIAKALGDE